jgi:hypothetical protein
MLMASAVPKSSPTYLSRTATAGSTSKARFATIQSLKSRCGIAPPLAHADTFMFSQLRK